MKQEYLFSSNEQLREIQDYSPQGVLKEIIELPTSNSYVVVFHLQGDNERNADALSKVNNYIMDKFAPTVLTNESSAYYNRTLFPIINSFERKLRKYLYLVNAVANSPKGKSNITNLEKKDLGEVFEMLFTDADFVKSTKLRVTKEISWQFTKDEIINSIADIEEHTLWDSLVNGEEMTTLRKQFSNTRMYRNDVMHAHNIDTEAFRSARRLFNKINEEMDVELERFYCNIPEKDMTHYNELALNMAKMIVLKKSVEEFKAFLNYKNQGTPVEGESSYHSWEHPELVGVLFEIMKKNPELSSTELEAILESEIAKERSNG